MLLYNCRITLLRITVLNLKLTNVFIFKTRIFGILRANSWVSQNTHDWFTFRNIILSRHRVYSTSSNTNRTNWSLRRINIEDMYSKVLSILKVETFYSVFQTQTVSIDLCHSRTWLCALYKFKCRSRIETYLLWGLHLHLVTLTLARYAFCTLPWINDTILIVL